MKPLTLVVVASLGAFNGVHGYTGAQKPLYDNLTPDLKPETRLFAALERLARLVDVSYCIGTTGIHKPFDCVSRCREFPDITLVDTWSTGMFTSDSVGYIAIDHSSQHGLNADPATPGSTVGSIIVAFRGTYSIANTIVDLSTVPQKYVPYPSPDDGGASPEKGSHRCDNCTVHSGFLSTWQSARKEVIAKLTELRKGYPDYPIQLVGHSLGGAVACLAALELRVSLGLDDVVVTTFGEPRAGNEGFVKFVDAVFNLHDDKDPLSRSYRRVTHTGDPVPLLPPGEWGYKSHAGEIHITKSSLPPSEKDLKFCLGDDDQDCSASEDSIPEQVISRLTPSSHGDASAAHIHVRGIPTRFKLWELFFSHRDYFWRLGLCVPGGDPANWGREPPSLDAGDVEL